MEIIIGAVVFGLIIIAIIVMVIINFSYRGVKKMREQIEDGRYQHLKEKEQKEKHPFGKDYFKSAATKKQQTARPASKPQEEKPKQQKTKQQEQPRQQTAQPNNQKETVRRTVTTDSNVTIIDDRHTGDKRKIFDDKDGEYVEFEEV
jgi:hypothetical protein